jgi:hypothetical protein
MRVLKAVLAISPLVAAVAIPLAVGGPAMASPAARLLCSASVSAAHPAHGTSTSVAVKTRAGAWVEAIAHYKTTTVKKTTHASSAGRATLAFKIGDAAYGYKIRVSVYVDDSSGKGRCSTSFTPTAPPKTYSAGSCRASGGYATCDEAATATDPVSIQVHVTSSPDQSVLVSWTMTCSQGLSAASTSGQFTAQTPIDRTVHHPYAHPGSCTIAAGAQLSEDHGSLHVWSVYER